MPTFQKTHGTVTEELHGHEVQAASVSLWDPNSSAPLFESGLQYFDATRPRIVLPLTVPYLETLRLTNQLRLRFATWLAPSAYSDQLIRVCESQPNEFVLDPTYWQTEVLPALGYPHVRLVPLTLDLPIPVQGSNLAVTEWKKATDSLNQSLQRYQSYHVDPGKLVRPLRSAVESALLTWAYLWNLEIPANKKADAALQTLNGQVKPCNAPNGIMPAAVQYSRLCSTLVMLHDLLQLSNRELHAGTAGAYSLNEAETILYLTFGILRGLPDLWQTYPAPPAPVPSTDSAS